MLSLDEERARVLHHARRRHEELALRRTGSAFTRAASSSYAFLFAARFVLVHALEVGERQGEPLLHPQELRVPDRAEDVALVAARRLLLEPRREVDGRLRERLVGLREPLPLRVVARAPDHLHHVAAQVRREAGEVARRDLGDRPRERWRQVLADVRDLGERGLLVVGEARGALLDRRVVAVDVCADREEVLVELRATFAARPCRRARTGLDATQLWSSARIERLVGSEGPGVDRGELRPRPARSERLARQSPPPRRGRPCRRTREGPGRAPWPGRRPAARRARGREETRTPRRRPRRSAQPARAQRTSPASVPRPSRRCPAPVPANRPQREEHRGRRSR